MNKLREWRIGKNIKQGKLAKRLKISVSYLSMLETGERTPSLAVALNVQKITAGIVMPTDFPRPP